MELKEEIELLEKKVRLLKELAELKEKEVCKLSPTYIPLPYPCYPVSPPIWKVDPWYPTITC